MQMEKMTNKQKLDRIESIFTIMHTNISSEQTCILSVEDTKILYEYICVLHSMIDELSDASQGKQN